MQKSGISFLLFACVWIFCAAPATESLAQEEPPARAHFDIPAQPLNSALIAFSKQAGVPVSAPTELIAGKMSRPVSGELTHEAALAQLLGSTGLEPRRAGTRTYLLAQATSSNDSAGQRTKNGHSTAPDTAQSADELTDSGVSPQSAVSKKNRAAGASLNDEAYADYLEEVIVTGTHIRGMEPVGALLITIDRAHIARSGFGRIDQVLQALPQNFGGAPSQDVDIVNSSNAFAGSSVDLRGLDSTLVLVNGRRQPLAGTRGQMTDISSIPLAAIERVEVLPDGASATYGSDAIGGVVNFILRDRLEGSETQLRYGEVTRGEHRELRASQLVGAAWNAGHLLIGYEYFDRESLLARDRDYAADSDLTPLGGSNFSNFRSNPGTIDVTGVGRFAIPAGQDGRSLRQSDLMPGSVNFGNTQEGLSLIPEQRNHSTILTISHEVTEGTELFVEARYGERTFALNPRQTSFRLAVPATNAFRGANNLFPGRQVFVEYSFTPDLGVRDDSGDVATHELVGGAKVDLSTNWRLHVYGSTAREKSRNFFNTFNFPALTAALADTNPATAFNPFGDGSHTHPATIDRIRGYVDTYAEGKSWSVDAHADGPIFATWGGHVRLAFGLNCYDQSFEQGAENFNVNPTPVDSVSRRGERNVKAAFAELLIPLVGSANAVRGFEQLNLSLAARYEDYSDFGDTANPKFGFVWAPIKGIAFRATYGTSYRAPNLTELDDQHEGGLFRARVVTLVDPMSPTGRSVALSLSGGNPDLQEQTATTWNAGIRISPTAMPSFTADVGYFDVDYEDRIDRVQSPGSALLAENQFGSLITRNPDVSVVSQYFAHPNFQDAVGGIRPEDISVIVDGRFQNLAITKVRGLDLSLHYERDLAKGHAWIGVDASHLLTYEQAVSAASPLVELHDAVGFPVDLRLRGSLGYTLGHVAASAFINYADDYVDNLSSPQRYIGSWTTADLQLSYEPRDEGPALLHDVRIALTAQNLFDKDPPFVNNPLGVGFDPANADPLGRFVALDITKSF